VDADQAYRAACELLSHGRGSDAAARAADLARRASAEGHAAADELLAVMAGVGVGAPQDWRAALGHLARAAHRGSACAQGQLAALGGAGFDLETWLAKPAKRVLSEAPRAVAVADFLPAAVCGWLIGRAVGRVRPAMLYDTRTGAARAGAGRSNSAFEFGFLDLDLVVVLVRAKMAAAIGAPVQVFETPQVLHYAVGQTFAAHFDALDARQPGMARQIAEAGQRVVTFIIYLNDDYQGGETHFPRLGLSHRGRAGDALYFANTGPDGAPDPRTLHAGLPPTAGEKWLFSQWIRNRSRG
jgi:prolyl 4-hydroxylase